VSGSEVTIKIFATGLAAGILLDATVVGALLVPSLRPLGLVAREGPCARTAGRTLAAERGDTGDRRGVANGSASGAPPRASGALRPRLGRCRHNQPGVLAGRHSSQRSRCESGAVPQLRCPGPPGNKPGRLRCADSESSGEGLLVGGGDAPLSSFLSSSTSPGG